MPFYGEALKVYVYIDGFNFYYGAVKNTPHKWLDIGALCSRILPNDTILKIKYFTARVSATPDDPDKPRRQNVYFRALKHYVPHLEIIEGYFQTKPATFRKYPSGGRVSVYKTEEKGSDVNLAVHLLNDAWKKSFEAALVISNDSDLTEAIRLVKAETGLAVGVVNPQLRRTARMAHLLNRVASFRKKLKVSDLKASQLPNPIPGTTLHKPESW